MKESYNNTYLAHFSRQNLVGLFWCCDVFSLAGNVYVLLFCSFLKLNNRSLSLSLSLGFPWHLPKFLSVMGCCPLCYFCCYFAQQCVFLLMVISECGFKAFMKFMKTVISRLLSV